jgi:hypothetical protein
MLMHVSRVHSPLVLHASDQSASCNVVSAYISRFDASVMSCQVSETSIDDLSAVIVFFSAATTTPCSSLSVCLSESTGVHVYFASFKQQFWMYLLSVFCYGYYGCGREAVPAFLGFILVGSL